MVSTHILRCLVWELIMQQMHPCIVCSCNYFIQPHKQKNGSQFCSFFVDQCHNHQSIHTFLHICFHFSSFSSFFSLKKSATWQIELACCCWIVAVLSKGKQHVCFWPPSNALLFAFLVGRRWMGLWTTPTNQMLMPLRCLWDRFHGPGLRSSFASYLSLMEQSMRLMFSETAARIHHRAKVSLL